MKGKQLKLNLFLATNLVLLSLFSIATAGTIGNPVSKVKKGSFRLGTELDFLKRDIEDESGDEIELKSNRYLLKGTYGITDQVNVYAKLGMDKMEIEDFEGDAEFAYGLGLNGTVFSKDAMKVGLAAQLFNTKNEDSGVEIKFMEYELAVGADYEGIENFIPYGGLFLSKIDGEVEVTGFGTGDIEEADLFGIFIGADYNVLPQFGVGAEVRLINETSFSLKLAYTF